MPSREKRERVRSNAEIRQRIARALANTFPSQVLGTLTPEQNDDVNKELGAGAGRYCIRGVKFDEFGCVIPPKNWGKNDTGRQNMISADDRCRTLREAAGTRWGKSHNIAWIIRKSEEIGLGAPCVKTIRGYFKRMP